MSAAAVVAVAVAVFLYIEAAIGTGYYMYLITRKNTDDTKTEEHKQLKKYSILAGVFFPITFAILIAGHAAGKRIK